MKILPAIHAGSCKAVSDMAAAPGGFTVLCSISWEGSKGWCGVISKSGSCKEDGSVSWPAKQATLKPPIWNCLIDTVQAGRQVLLEVAR
jgi:hypothetical protein